MTDNEKQDRESGLTLNPKYDSNGLITAVVTDVSSGDVLMVAFMNAEALDLTLKTDVAHFYSRSRQALWKKGETSGNILDVVEVRIDCDQDALWVKAKPAGPTCHTGTTSCFYRKVKNGQLESIA
ncbi:MAG: phosphoribosyl-AMP cyclohydrolase [Parasphingorhabdus sp.]|uniref:phosphoribosyl-AMP cyclohydrolase n=1 Tax=Parasphingorhabdus sp. TaxID=2709688 RepID=UPI0030017B59